MRPLTLVALVATLTAPLADAQVGYDPTPYVPRVTVAGGYQFIQANAPPAVDNHFRTNGGFVAAGYTLRYWLRAVGEVTGTHGNNIGPLGQNLTLLTYTGGPQVVFHTGRLQPYAHALFGAAHGSDSYFPSTNSFSTTATSFAYQLGGGVDYELSHRFSIRAVDAQYLHTGFPNGTNNAQNHLLLGAGIVWKLHGSLWTPDPGNQRAKANKAMRRSEPAASASPAVAAAPAATPAVAPPPPAADRSPGVAAIPSAATGAGGGFRDRVKDALFDYDSYQLRPDALLAIEQDAAYLKEHPNTHIVWAATRTSAAPRSTTWPWEKSAPRQRVTPWWLAACRPTRWTWSATARKCRHATLKTRPVFSRTVARAWNPADDRAPCAPPSPRGARCPVDVLGKRSVSPGAPLFWQRRCFAEERTAPVTPAEDLYLSCQPERP